MEAPGKASSSRRKAGNGLEAEKRPWRGKPTRVAEPKGRTGRNEADWDLKQQAGNFDPVAEALRGAITAGEGKAVARVRSRREQRAWREVASLER